MAVLCRLETIERQVKFGSDSVKRGTMKLGALIVEIHHPAGEGTPNAVKVKQRKLTDSNATQRPAFNHENFLPKGLILITRQIRL